MNFNLSAQHDFVFHNFGCALPKDTIDIEVTIWTVDGIHTYKRDRTTQITLYSPWSRQVKSFPSLRKRRSFNPFTPVRETNFGKERSRRSQKSRKYRKLDMGHFSPSTVASTWPTTTATTTMENLSVPCKPPNTLNVQAVPKPSRSSQPSKTWAMPYTPVPLLSLVPSDWPQRKIGVAPSRRRESTKNH